MLNSTITFNSTFTITEFAVTTKGEIKFFDASWNFTISAAQQFDELSAITFDETEELLYFNDLSYNISSIVSLHLERDYSQRIEDLGAKTKGEIVQGITYDPLDRVLYWTDSKNKLIYHMAIENRTDGPKVLIKFNNNTIPSGIAIDVCRRKLYWTNSNARHSTIERASVDGSKHEVLVDQKLFMPSSIAVDQFSRRIFWVDSDVEGVNYSIESAAFDGTDRQSLVNGKDNSPFNLAVDHDSVYWTDKQSAAVWRIKKNRSDDLKPEKVQEFKNNPRGIIARGNLLSTQANNTECAAVVNKIKFDLVTPNTTTEAAATVVTSSTATYQSSRCMNGGSMNKKTGTCICTNEYKGVQCEIGLCHNYCLEGKCFVGSTGYAQCECNATYTGERCEQNLCYGFCLNGGLCSFERNQPVCHCSPLYHGRHCEQKNVQEMCRDFCDYGINDSELNLFELCSK